MAGSVAESPSFGRSTRAESVLSFGGRPRALSNTLSESSSPSAGGHATTRREAGVLEFGLSRRQASLLQAQKYAIRPLTNTFHPEIERAYRSFITLYLFGLYAKLNRAQAIFSLAAIYFFDLGRPNTGVLITLRLATFAIIMVGEVWFYRRPTWFLENLQNASITTIFISCLCIIFGAELVAQRSGPESYSREVVMPMFYLTWSSVAHLGFKRDAPAFIALFFIEALTALTHEHPRAHLLLLRLLLLLMALRVSYASDRTLRLQWVGMQLIQDELRAIRKEKRRSDLLLRSILPRSLAEQVKRGITPPFQHHDTVSVFFCDIVGFTPWSARLESHVVVQVLNTLFTALDDLTRRHHMEKIMTVGDAYVAVAGAPVADPAHSRHATQFALAVQATVSKLIERDAIPKISVRIGVGTGGALSGVVGETKYQFLLVGPALELAMDMESSGRPREVHLSGPTVADLSVHSAQFAEGLELSPGKQPEDGDRFVARERTSSDHPLQPQQSGSIAPIVVDLGQTDSDVGTAESLPQVDVATPKTAPHENPAPPEGQLSRPTSAVSSSVAEDDVLDLMESLSGADAGRMLGRLLKASGYNDRWQRYTDKETEADFRRNLLKSSPKRLRATLMVAIALWAAFGVVDFIETDIEDVLAVTASRGAAMALLAFVAWCWARAMARSDHLGADRLLRVFAICYMVAHFAVVATSDLPAERWMDRTVAQAVAVMVVVSFELLTPLRTSTVYLVFLAVISHALYVAVGVEGERWQNSLFLLVGLTIVLLVGWKQTLRNMHKSHRLKTILERGHRELKTQHAATDALLLNIFPYHVFDVLVSPTRPSIIAESCPQATCMFVRLLEAGDMTEPSSLERLHLFVGKVERILQANGVEKIKVFGTDIFAATGIKDGDDPATCARQCLSAATEIAALDFPLAIGLNSGPLTAGVMGTHKLQYDLWGDTVNTAARMASYAAKERAVFATQPTKELIGEGDTEDGPPSTVEFADLGVQGVKGKGLMRLFRVAV